MSRFVGNFLRRFCPAFSMWVYFLPEFAGFPVAVATFQGGLVTAWLILSRGDGQSRKTENGNDEKSLTGLSGWEGCLQYSFSIIASSDRETTHNRDRWHSRNLFSTRTTSSQTDLTKGGEKILLTHNKQQRLLHLLGLVVIYIYTSFFTQGGEHAV